MFIVFCKGVDTYAVLDFFVILIIAERSVIIRFECVVRNDGCVIKIVMLILLLDLDVRLLFNLSNVLMMRSLIEVKIVGEYSRYEIIFKSCIFGCKLFVLFVKLCIMMSFSILKMLLDIGWVLSLFCGVFFEWLFCCVIFSSVVRLLFLVVLDGFREYIVVRFEDKVNDLSCVVFMLVFKFCWVCFIFIVVLSFMCFVWSIRLFYDVTFLNNLA